jgi:CRP/FNR family transcriptional regulator, cyclic AMP receptor protein
VQPGYLLHPDELRRPHSDQRDTIGGMTSSEEVLATVPLFSMLKPKELKRLAADGHDISYDAGTVLTEQEDFGSTFFVLLEGTLEVSVGDRVTGTMGPGDTFGEMALIDGKSRSATVKAASDARCLVFTQWVFRPFALDHPEVAWAMLELMVARLREAEARSL